MIGNDEHPQISACLKIRSQKAYCCSSLWVRISKGIRGPSGSAIMRHTYINILKNARELLKPQHYRHGFSSVRMLMSVASCCFDQLSARWILIWQVPTVFSHWSLLVGGIEPICKILIKMGSCSKLFETATYSYEILGWQVFCILWSNQYVSLQPFGRGRIPYHLITCHPFILDRCSLNIPKLVCLCSYGCFRK